MISYIINTTAIWVVSLLAFDLLLRKDNGYVRNRIYLISTLVFGLVLPLIQFPVQQAITTPQVQLTMAQVNTARQTVANAAAPVQAQVSILLMCSFIYLAGLVVSISLLLREAFLLAGWYRTGRRERRDGYTIVYTDKSHGPFSVLGLMFISAEHSYTATELSFILSHEQRHIRSLHSWDKFAVLLLRCLFWFHPLVYVYYKRLMMVHEFEADAAATEPEEYGVFLISQHLAGVTPGISHSFNHSPLKTRIRMLSTTRSQTWRKAAYAIALPAIVAFGVLWVNSTSAHKREKQGNTVVFDGNKIELGVPLVNGKPATTEKLIVRHNTDSKEDNKTVKSDTKVVPIVPNPGGISAEPITVSFTLSPVPLKINGEDIYDDQNLNQKIALKDKRKTVMATVVEDAGSVLGQLQDGRYRVRILSLVIDKSGRAVYYEVDPIEWYTKPVSFSGSDNDMKLLNARTKEREAHKVDPALSQQIMAAIESSLDRTQFTPAMKNGKPVVAFTSDYSSLLDIEVIKVANGKASAVKQ
jgi:beta-lactamase regulating signal transducer with metallopeptidase domain